MKNLRPSTLGFLKQVESLSGRPVEFRPDSTLTLRATLQLARHGAPAHLLRYRTTNEPLDYWVAYQAAYALRLFELPADARMDLRGTGEAERQVEALLRAGQPLDAADREALPRYKQIVAHWALMNLRSFPIGLRIDQWLASEHPEMRELQLAGIDAIQQENLQVLSKRLGNLSVPTTLLGPVAACALVADRIRGTESYAIPYHAAGVLDHGHELLAIFDATSADAAHDRDLVDAWGRATGMQDWYSWIPYEL